MEKIVLISGMKCSGCANRVKNSLLTLKEIKKVNVDLESKKATITYKKDILDSLIIEKIESLGFKVEGIE